MLTTNHLPTIRLFDIADLNPHKCCEDGKVRFKVLELDASLSPQKVREFTTNKEYLLFNVRIENQNCWHCNRKYETKI